MEYHQFFPSVRFFFFLLFSDFFHFKDPAFIVYNFLYYAFIITLFLILEILCKDYRNSLISFIHIFVIWLPKYITTMLAQWVSSGPTFTMSEFPQQVKRYPLSTMTFVEDKKLSRAWLLEKIPTQCDLPWFLMDFVKTWLYLTVFQVILV